MRMSKGYLEPLVIFIFGVTFVHANLCTHILASTCQDVGNPFPVIRLPVVNSVTDSSRHTLLLPALHSQRSRQVYIIHQSITGFLVVQAPTFTHAHEYRLLGASWFFQFPAGIKLATSESAVQYCPYPLGYDGRPKSTIAKINI